MLQAIHAYIDLVVAMREDDASLPDVAMIKGGPFFYTKLMQTGNLMYDAVKNWTKNMGNLMEKDKILFPINDKNHWVSPRDLNPNV